jgi:hypothetical protein
MADESEPVELYRARGADEAHVVRALLEQAGIPARVDGELLGGIVGEVPFGWVTAPRLMVPRGRLEAAEAVLADFLGGPAGTPRPPAAGGEGDLRCLSCGADMGEAETCPACGWSYEGGAAE